MIFKKETCAKCRSERAVRVCPRKGNNLLGWKCCNAMRVDTLCPEKCPYAPKIEIDAESPFPAFRSDSNTEFVQAVKRFIDLWCFKPSAALDGLSPSEYASKNRDKMLAWLGGFRYPANFPVNYLMQRLEIPHEDVPDIETPETVAFAFMDNAIALEWDGLRNYTINDWDRQDFISRYRNILSSIPELNKVKQYDILHAGAANDGVSAMVALVLNQKLIWTILLSSVSGKWRIKQNINGSPKLYYEQNKLFRDLADALGNGKDQDAWDLLRQNMPLYPDCADLYYYRALYWQLAKQMDKCEDDLLNALALDNHFFEAGFTLATLFLSKRDLPKALEILNMLHNERPDDLNVLNNIAACEAGLGHSEKATKIWSNILIKDPDYEPAKKNLERHPR